MKCLPPLSALILVFAFLSSASRAATFNSTGVSGNWTTTAVWRWFDSPSPPFNYPTPGERAIINGAGLFNGQTLTISVTTNLSFGQPSNSISPNIWAHGTLQHPININVATNCTLKFIKYAYMDWTTASWGGVDGPGRLVNEGEWSQGTAGFMSGVQGTFENQGNYFLNAMATNSMVLDGRAVFHNGTNGTFSLYQFAAAGNYSFQYSSNGVFRNAGTIKLNSRTLQFGTNPERGAILELLPTSLIIPKVEVGLACGKILYHRNLALAGAVDMNFYSLYTPTVGASFTILETTGVLSGTVRVLNPGWEANIIGGKRLVVSRVVDSVRPDVCSTVMWSNQPQFYWMSGGRTNVTYSLYYRTNITQPGWLLLPGAAYVTNRAWYGPYPDAPYWFLRVGFQP